MTISLATFIRNLRALSLRQTGGLLMLLALLLTIVNYALQATLHYPEVLLDDTSFAHTLVIQNRGTILLSFCGLLLCGVLLIAISFGLIPMLDDKQRPTTLLSNRFAGFGWVVCALLGLVLVPLWDSANTVGAAILTTILFGLAEIITPLLLAFWTVRVARRLQLYRTTAFLGALGLLLTALRSLLWSLNTALPPESGFYLTAGIVNILALLTGAIWLYWLFLAGLRLCNQPVTISAATGQTQHKQRRTLLRLAARTTLGLVGGTFALARSGLTATSTPPLQSARVPAVPSLMGTFLYLVSWIFLKLFPVTLAQTAAQSSARKVPLPAGVTLEEIDASGVPAELVCAPGASKSRALLFLHGGGFAAPLTDAYRTLAAKLSQATGACVLLPQYRLTPTHPFPAALQDCVSAYRWLHGQGIAARQIVIIGDSAGGNLTLTTALSLRENEDPLPAALVAMSPATDLTMSGETQTSRANADPFLANGLAEEAFQLYTRNGTLDRHNPLISPLFADLKDFPPTLLQVGTQEILLSDSTRMAERLRTARVPVQLEVWPGMWHVWQLSGDVLPEAQLAIQHVVQYINDSLS
jgi:monoterpene epsilon-lactone hydrolase